MLRIRLQTIRVGAAVAVAAAALAAPQAAEAQTYDDHSYAYEYAEIEHQQAFVDYQLFLIAALEEWRAQAGNLSSYAWAPCPGCWDAMDSWRYQQYLNDLGHQAFIDAIWDRETPSGEYGYAPAHYGGYYDTYGPSYHGYGYSAPGHYDYWDPMESWRRQQWSNDRQHDAFIDYIRN